MSFKKLPTEVKQLITDHVQRSDKRYQERFKVEEVFKNERINRVEFGSYDDGLKKGLRGKAFNSWSRVNRECRELCLKILFGTLTATSAQKPVFQFRLLNGPAVSTFTKLVLDTRANSYHIGLTLCLITGRLPNLSTVIIESSQALATPETPADDQKACNSLQLSIIAKSITRWEFDRSVTFETLKPLIEANKDNILSVSLGLVGNGAADKRLNLLSRSCPSLEHLQINYDVPSGKKTIFPDTALRGNKYCFRERLTSLSISLTIDAEEPDGSSRGVINRSVLRFAALFPSLRKFEFAVKYTHGTSSRSRSFASRSVPSRTRAPSSSTDSDSLDDSDDSSPSDTTDDQTPSSSSSDPRPIPPSRATPICRLPSVTHLTLRFSTLAPAYETLLDLDLPNLKRLSIESLDVETGSYSVEEDDSLIHEMIDRIQQQAKLKLLESTTRDHHSTVVGLLLVHILQRRFGASPEERSIPFHIRHDGIGPRGQTSEPAKAAPIDLMLSGRAEQLSNFAEWLQARINVVRNERGLEELEAMYKSLEELEEYKRWLQD
ncbi:uncharacterized protein JCM6883_006577 [Sporobolomyces salmoneus]|uniref:uncharacterized protein n=1 Tax=Sporobolomyces salmoneus TaxID=183962 RepID=UPI00317E4D23